MPDFNLGALPSPISPAELYFDLGNHSFPISTKSQDAQIWFDRGLIWSYAFNHEESFRCFKQALAHDSTCSMAYWGLSYAAGPNYNKTWQLFDPTDLGDSFKICYSASRKVEGLADQENVKSVERALIKAIQARFPVNEPVSDFSTLDLPYAYPVAFGEDREWSMALKDLPLLAIICGTFFGAALIIAHNKLYFRHQCHTPDGTYIPETCLPPMIVGCVMVPIGMFWVAWTATTSAVSWASPICASFMIGCGMYLLFIQGWNYIIDCYTNVANSAMGVNGSMRSVFGAVFPLFANQMVHALGVAKTTTILGAISAALVPVPICFWYWGHRIRAWSSAKDDSWL